MFLRFDEERVIREKVGSKNYRGCSEGEGLRPDAMQRKGLENYLGRLAGISWGLGTCMNSESPDSYMVKPRAQASQSCL